MQSQKKLMSILYRDANRRMMKKKIKMVDSGDLALPILPVTEEVDINRGHHSNVPQILAAELPRARRGAGAG
jgi:hypothetical protein